MTSDSLSFRTLLRAIGGRALLTPFISAVIALLSAATAIVAAQRGQFIDFAAYSAGLGAAAIVSTVIGGGTSLTYVTGDLDARVAVRTVRNKFILPALTVTSIIVAVAVHQQNQKLPLYSLILGGFTVVLSQLAELEGATLQRTGRIITWSAAMAGSRVVALGAILLGGGYSVSMTAGSFVLLATLYVSTYREHESRNASPPMRLALRRAYHSSHSLISILGVVVIRLPFLVAPLLTDAATAGAFAILLSAFQTVGGLITSTLYSVMTMRGDPDTPAHTSRPLRNMEWLVIASSLPIALAGAGFAGVVIKILKVTGVQSSKEMWLLLMVSLPLVAINRAVQYRFLTAQRRSLAAALLALVGVACIAVCAVALFQRSVLSLSLCSLLPEALGLVAYGSHRAYAGSSPVTRESRPRTKSAPGPREEG